MAKNYLATLFWLCVPVILLYDLGSTLYAMMMRGNMAILCGRLAVLCSLPAVWRQISVASLSDLPARRSHIESPLALLQRFQPLPSLLLVNARPDTRP